MICLRAEAFTLPSTSGRALVKTRHTPLPTIVADSPPLQTHAGRNVMLFVSLGVLCLSHMAADKPFCSTQSAWSLVCQSLYLV